MNRHKIFKYGFILFLITSLGFNYFLYKENEGFMIQIGSAHQVTVRLTLHELKNDDTDLWIEILNEENGDVRLERHIGELNRLSREFDRMSGEMSVIGMLIDSIVNHYYELEGSVKTGTNIEEHKKAINTRIQLIKTVLSKIDADLGENPKLWYKELSGFETETQVYVWKKFKEFEAQNFN